MASIIGTWRMCYESVLEAYTKMQAGMNAEDAVENAISAVERNPRFYSVGFGGLPANDGQVYMDAGWMDGTTLRCGGVMSVRYVSSPIRAARLLCGREKNWLLCGLGAEAFALKSGIEMRDMVSTESFQKWREQTASSSNTLNAYTGHDTVCVIARDNEGKMIVGTSTSGLFMKDPGRVGDTPIVGSGFYCDAEYGAAAATGLGEDIMRGCLSYETVRCMRDGKGPQEAATIALQSYVNRCRHLGETMDDKISLIAMDRYGNPGAATTLSSFPFAAGTSSGFAMYEARCLQGTQSICKRNLSEIPLDC